MDSRGKENVMIQQGIFIQIKSRKPMTYFVYFEDCGARSWMKRSVAATHILF